jgi:hypothetical protein
MTILSIIILAIVFIGVAIAIFKLGIISVSVKNIIVSIIILLSLLAILIPTLLLVFMDLIKTPAPPPPEIRYGEFPFRIEYEMDGERYIIEDTLIAEFVRSSEGSATSIHRRVWNSRLKSGNERIFLLKEAVNVTISFSPGFAEYFMGDLDRGRGNLNVQNQRISLQPRIVVRTVDENGRPNVENILLEDAQNILAEYGILLISWKLTEPVVNSIRDINKRYQRKWR